MSEYQYYEFQAIDQPLDKEAMDALRNLSSRAQITPTGFINEYNYGDFKGTPLKLMAAYFDAFLYVANWGTREFMLKVPLRLVNYDLVKEYCGGESVTAYRKGENVIFQFTSDTDEPEWEEGNGWLSSLLALRSDILNGDYRCLYFGWLYCAQMEEFEDDEMEPSVPPNLGNLNDSLVTFVDFLRIDNDLVAVAAQNSASTKVFHMVDKEALGAWISNIPDREKDDVVLRLIQGHDPHLGAELLQRYRNRMGENQDGRTIVERRSVNELIAKGKIYAAERKKRIAEKKAKEAARIVRKKAVVREKYLNELGKREDQVWKQIDELIDTKRPSDYDSAVQLLVDLRELGIKRGKEKSFLERLEGIREKHRRKPSLIERLKKADLIK
ncbi:conserved hypothetical protein [delta proteobacterium NaphS2]|nr:conserved hypothetical protein [delta proteobacterium NaphS2]